VALRVLLDAHLPAALAELLRARGYDVVAAQAIPALRSLDDRSLLAEAANSAARLLRTTSATSPRSQGSGRRLDENTGESSSSTPHTILQRDLGAQLLALEKLLASTPEDGLRNSTVFLEP